MSAINKLKEFVVDYLRIKSIQIPDLNLLKELCKDTTSEHIYTIIKKCTRHIIRHELKDIPESLLKDYENDDRTCLHVAAENKNFAMIDILFEKLRDDAKLQLLQMKLADTPQSVPWISLRNRGVTWAMDLANAANHENLKKEIYKAILVYTCQNDDAAALQLLLDAVPSDTIISVLDKLTCIHKAAKHGIHTFISMLSQHVSPEYVLPFLLARSRSDGGKTALHIACDWNRLLVVKTIIDLVHAEDKVHLLGATDHNEETILHSAVASNNKSLILALQIDQLSSEQQHALLKKENHNGLSVMDLAKQQNNTQIERYLSNILHESCAELSLAKQIDRRTVQRDELDHQISQLMIQLQREQQKPQITKNADVKMKPDVGEIQNKPTNITMNKEALNKDLSPATPLQMNIFLPEIADGYLDQKQSRSASLNELSSIDDNLHTNQFALTANNLNTQFYSEKAPSNLYTKLDIAEAIHPLRGPESILEHQLVEVQEEGAAASFAVTGSQPQNAKDDYSSEK